MLSKHWAYGSQGAVDLAKAVYAATEQGSNFKFLYELGLPLKDKIEIISKEMYGAGKITYSEEALEKIRQYEEQVRIRFSLFIFLISFNMLKWCNIELIFLK